MVYRVNVYIPETLIQEKSSEILKLYDNLNISSITRIKCDPDLMISARVTESYLNEVTNGLEEIGVGISFGIMDVIDLLVTVPAIKKTRHKSFRANSRPLRSLRAEVSSNAGLSLDYIIFTIVASIISGMGLASNSSVAVVASMLVSPLMGPIMGFTIGVLMRDKKLLLKSLLSETIGIILCFASGFLIGLIVTPLAGNDETFGVKFDFPSEEMQQRGQPVSLFWGLLIAIPSGIGVAISQTLNSIASLVGVAISAALLPPIVNSGINFSAFIFAPLVNSTNFQSYKDSLELLKISGFSMLLFIENMALIIIFAMFILICKRVRPIKKEHKLYQSLSGITHLNDTDYDITSEGATIGLLGNEKTKKESTPNIQMKKLDSEETLLQPLISLDDNCDIDDLNLRIRQQNISE
mmetsp:Transcript_826/g.1290  ORF Transcript_826/g.1290 Transcript_826/m.1290 type:complete len:410 (-) Transcript_826:1022-2251(-)